MICERTSSEVTEKWLLDHVAYQGDDCLPWPFRRDSRVGRGRLLYKKKLEWAHRVMCKLAHGEPPTSKHQAAHSCGNGHEACVNPRHLSWKTNQENSMDRSAHGNAINAWWGNKGKLRQEQVEAIKALRGKQAQVRTAAAFGVSLSCVQYHQTGKENWPSHARRKAS